MPAVWGVIVRGVFSPLLRTIHCEWGYWAFCRVISTSLAVVLTYPPLPHPPFLRFEPPPPPTPLLAIFVEERSGSESQGSERYASLQIVISLSTDFTMCQTCLFQDSAFGLENIFIECANVECRSENGFGLFTQCHQGSWVSGSSRKGVGLWTIIWAVATPVPDSLSHPIPTIQLLSYYHYPYRISLVKVGH